MVGRRRFGLVLLALGLAGCPGPGPDEVFENFPPSAALRTPVIVAVGSPAVLDARESTDPDGDPLTYTFEINGVDSIRSAEAVANYVFTGEGLFTVTLRVTDILGNESIARQDITAILDFPEPPDFCSPEAPCVVGDECDGGVCFAVGGTLP